MPGATHNVGTGTTITFGTSAFSSRLLSVNWSGIHRNAHETTYMGVAAPSANTFGNRTFMVSDLSDPGELQVEFQFDADKNPPLDSAIETITITFPVVGSDMTGAAWAANGMMTDYEINVPLDDVMTCTMTIKLSGAVTMTDAT